MAEAATNADELALPSEPTVWPRTIGVISLIYAALGGCCALGMGVSTVSSEVFMKMGGIDFQMPAWVKVMAAVGGVIGVAFGVMLLVGSIGLLRRRPAGVRWLKAWVILRLVILILMQPVAILLLPANIKLQMEMQEAMAQQLRRQNPSAKVPMRDEASIRRWTQVQVVAGAVGPALYPLFLGLYLSRRRVRAEVSTWSEGMR
jgi:hypothetical protein